MRSLFPSRHSGFASLVWFIAAGIACLVTRPIIVLADEPKDSKTSVNLVVMAEKVYTMAGKPIEHGVVLISDGKIVQVGSQEEVSVPKGIPVVRAEVATPGLVDAHSVVGLAGILNQDEDQDQLDNGGAIQPQLRAGDAYNPLDPLVEWIRGFGVTTVHTGHAPGALISGQTMVVKTIGTTVDQATLVPAWGVAVTLGDAARGSGKSSPGTRGKMVSMLRQKLLDAQRYRDERAKASEEEGGVENGEGEKPQKKRTIDLEMEALADCLDGKLRFLVTADRSVDIRNAIELAREFQLKLVLDSGAEAYLMIDLLRANDIPVIVHPTMARANGERENLTFRNASLLASAGVPVALQSGFEAYVPKTRVVLFEAAVAASHDLGREKAMSAITIDAAKLLGIDHRVGSLEVGKDGDIALYDGDPFEYTTHCTAVVIEGRVVHETPR